MNERQKAPRTKQRKLIKRNQRIHSLPLSSLSSQSVHGKTLSITPYTFLFYLCIAAASFLLLLSSSEAFINPTLNCKNQSQSSKSFHRKYYTTGLKMQHGRNKEEKQPNNKEIVTLSQFLQQHCANDEELAAILYNTAKACIEISEKLKTMPITSFLQQQSNDDEKPKEGGTMNVQGEIQKPMDIMANEIFIKSLQNHVGALASEEEEEYILFGRNPNKINNKKYEVAFDPLDGSSNLDVSVPTGSIFGIAPYTPHKPFSSPGRKLVAAGYAVYSSSVELVISLANNNDDDDNELFASGFTLATPELLDRLTGRQVTEENNAERFILSRPNIKIPPSGSYYSLNDGREPDWPTGLQRWIYDAKRGKTPSGTIYSSRYICSLCADVHRTLIKGGWAGNPRPHLRLLYEAAPLAHVLEACGGKGSNGVINLLDVDPVGLHDRTCVFLGSVNDILELEAYGDVQQSAKTYSR